MRIRNFKGFAPDADWFPMGELTLILGPNSSGKSSILQAILLLAQSWSKPMSFVNLTPDGEYLQLGHVGPLFHYQNIDAPMSFAFELDGHWAVEFNYGLDAGTLSGGDALRAASGRLHSVRTAQTGAIDEPVWLSWAPIPEDSTGVSASVTARFELQSVYETNGLPSSGSGEPGAFTVRDWLLRSEYKQFKVLGEKLAKLFASEESDRSIPDELFALAISAEGIDFLDSGLIWAPLEEPDPPIDPNAPFFAAKMEDHWRKAVMRLRDLLLATRYVGPARLAGKRLHPDSQEQTDLPTVGRDGARLASALKAVTPAHFGSVSLTQSLNTLLERIGVRYRLSVVPVPNDGYRLGWRITLQSEGRAESESGLDLCDVGYGVSQLVPILAQWAILKSWPAVSTQRERLMLVEQPELHLHPRWQAGVTSALLDLWPGEPTGVFDGEADTLRPQAFVETHSELMVLRLCRLIRDGQIPADSIATAGTVLVAEQQERSDRRWVTSVTSVPIEYDGYFERHLFPDGFFADRLDEERL
jgi:hypothetical protein